ncbi:MAG: cytochrome c [Bacteroidetes bacterium]|nr:MAG: cytochrome c [Bacteroidota bacterium]
MRFSFILLVCVSVALSAYQPEPLALSKQRGKKVYELNCQTCHGEDGKGEPSIFPPLAQADYLMQNRTRAIRQVLYGARGTMIVNGHTYTGEMPAQGGLSDTEVADVLNYVRNAWGNQDNSPISPQDVRAQRR